MKFALVRRVSYLRLDLSVILEWIHSVRALGQLKVMAPGLPDNQSGNSIRKIGRIEKSLVAKELGS